MKWFLYDFGQIHELRLTHRPEHRAFSSHAEASAFLRRCCASHPKNYATLRRLLASQRLVVGGERLSNHAVTMHAAGHLARGMFSIDGLGVSRRTPHGSAGEPREAPPPPEPVEAGEDAYAEPAPSPVPPPVEPTNEENLDAAVQAAALRQAARSGAPFCEKCEKARREREARMAA